MLMEFTGIYSSTMLVKSEGKSLGDRFFYRRMDLTRSLPVCFQKPKKLEFNRKFDFQASVGCIMPSNCIPFYAEFYVDLKECNRKARKNLCIESYPGILI